MKLIKYIFAGAAVFLLFILPSFNFFYGVKEEIQFLLMAIGLMVLLSILNYKESIEKAKNILKLNIVFTRWLAYTICTLPYLYPLLRKPPEYPFLRWLIILYLIFLILAIFNYAIEVKQPKTQEE